MNNVAHSEQLFDCRDAFSSTIEQLATNNPDIVIVCNDSIGSSKLGEFQKLFPDRLINVGIAEQNMVGVSAGLANGGKIPFVCSASCFLTARALEQIKADIAYSDANVKLIGMSSGLAYGALGPTHHSIEDFAWIRAISNIPVIAPSDRVETAASIKWAEKYVGPCFLRLSRVGVPDIFSASYTFELGKSCELTTGSDLSIISNGTVIHRVLKSVELLNQQGIETRVINMPTIRPIDIEMIVKVAKETGAILTCEEHTIYGGLGSAVAEVIVEHYPIPMKRLGVPGIFPPTGSADFLLDEFGLSPAGITKSALELMKRK